MTTELQTIDKAGDAGILAVIARAAADPNCDVDKLDRMLAMHERVMANQARMAFDAAMNEAQQKLGRVMADKKNNQTSSSYASEAALDRAIRPVYAAHGFSLTFNTGESKLENHVLVLCDVAHAQGHTKPFSIDMPADGKGARGNDVMTKTHATGSAVSYGRRYLLKMIFNISIGDDDDGNSAGGVKYLSAEQSTAVHILLNSLTKEDEAAFLKFMKAENVVTILAKDFDKAVNALNKKIASKGDKP